MPFYHFTDTRNLPSIKRHGLLSWYNLRNRNIDHFPASNDLSRKLDLKKSLENYVRLCLKPNHPMASRALSEGRIQRIAWLVIDDAVSRWRSTLYSNTNATANNAVIDHDIRTIYNSFDSQAEVLVEGGISLKWITFP